MLTNDNKMAKVKDDKHGKVILLSLKAADVKKNMIKLKPLEWDMKKHS